jgi:hypothetical protein
VVGLDEGLARTVAYFRDRIEELKTEVARPAAALALVNA